MKFSTIPEQDIYTYIADCYLSEKYDLLLTLTDGKSLVGRIKGKAWVISGKSSGLVSVSEQCFGRPGYLELYYGATFNEHSIFVPLEQIAGIYPIFYTQQQIDGLTERFGGAYFHDSAYEYFFQDLLSKAEKYDFPVERHFHLYSLSMVKPFDWGNITFSDDVPLYSDWNYLQRVAGGINSIGVGVAILSLSAGWDSSLWSLFKKKVKEREAKLEISCAKPETVVTGFVSFFEKYIDFPNLNKEIVSIDVEGSNWVAAAVTTQRIQSISELNTNQWQLVYFNSVGFMFPANLWEKMTQPIRIFAEVVPVSINTEAGQQNCFLKARCAAYVS